MFEWFLDAVGLPQICIPASVEAVVVDQNVLLAVVLGVLVVELGRNSIDILGKSLSLIMFGVLKHVWPDLVVP